MFLRNLLPSWKFFDRMGAVPSLFYRYKYKQKDYGPWISGIKKPKRQWYHLFYNPKGNLYLAKHSLLLQLLEDIQRLPDSKGIQSYTSYHLVKQIAISHLLETPSPASSFQFKLHVTNGIESYDALISSEHQYEP